MARFIVDEDTPRSVAPALRAIGIDAVDVRDVGLRSKSDEEIVAWATQEGRAVITCDVGMASIQRFPLGTHGGIVLARYPSQPSTQLLTRAIVTAVQLLALEDLAGAIVVIGPTGIRIRRADPT